MTLLDFGGIKLNFDVIDFGKQQLYIDYWFSNVRGVLQQMGFYGPCRFGRNCDDFF